MATEPGKVIALHAARRRVVASREARVRAVAKRRIGKPTQRVGLLQGAVDWLTGSTTKGTILLAAIVAGLVFGAVVSTAVVAAQNAHTAAAASLVE